MVSNGGKDEAEVLQLALICGCVSPQEIED
jgi:hypothetical protein